MSDAARQILVVGAAAVARGDDLGSSLRLVLEAIAGPLQVGSAAVVVVDPMADRLDIAASHGLGDEAAAGLAAAVNRPGHPIARTVADAVASFNVLPTAPGGPALRSHLPLVVRRDGADTVLGVLALAHDRPFEADAWPLLRAGADLAAVAVERHRGT